MVVPEGVDPHDDRLHPSGGRAGGVSCWRFTSVLQAAVFGEHISARDSCACVRGWDPGKVCGLEKIEDSL